MQTRRDRYHAYRFVARRGAYALLHGAPDTPETPLRRLGVASIGGLSMLVLLAAVFGVYGALSPGNSDAWRQPGSLIVERDSGTRFVLVDGQLHPVLNFASARLVLGATAMHTVLVAPSALAGVRRGLSVGIPGAPDSLPDTAKLISAPWTACSGLAAGTDQATTPTASLDLGGTTIGQTVGKDDALLVRSTDGTRFLVWHGRRLKIVDQAVLTALGDQADTPTIVADAWLSAVPVGPDLQFPDVADRGQPGPSVGARATRIGQVLVVHTPGTQDAYYLVRGDGVAPLTALGSALVVGDPASHSAYPGQAPVAIPVGAADIAASTRSAQSSIVAGYPAKPPRVVDPASADLCAQFADPSSLDSGAVISIPAAGSVPTSADAVRNTGDTATADVVHLAVGRGVIARASAGQVTYVITDLGIKYPLASADVLATLGFGGVTPSVISSTLLSLIPTGPTLDPASARLTQTVAATKR